MTSWYQHWIDGQYITATSRESYSSHRQSECLFSRLLSLTSNKTTKSQLPFVRGIHRSPVDSPDKRALNVKSVPMPWRHDTIIIQQWTGSRRPRDASMRRQSNHHCSNNGFSPGRRQAIIWTNAGILLFGPLGTNFSEIFVEFYIFLFKKMHFNLSSGNWRPFCFGLNVLVGGLGSLPFIWLCCNHGH